MKKIFTLAAILFSVASFAANGNPHPNDSKVAIRSNSDAFIKVFIDNIRSGRHRIEVYKVDNYGRFRRRPQMVYSNTTFVKPWESLNINIGRGERVWVDTRFDRDDRYDRNDRWDNDRDRDYGRGRDYNDHDGRYNK
jgi:hypothetical protein